MSGTPARSNSPVTKLSSATSSTRAALLTRVGSISVPVSVQLCHRRMTLSAFLALGPGSFIPFPTPCDEPLKLRVEGSTIALGEAVRNGATLGLRVNRFVESHEQPKFLGHTPN